jgi:hypothetical protein
MTMILALINHCCKLLILITIIHIIVIDLYYSQTYYVIPRNNFKSLFKSKNFKLLANFFFSYNIISTLQSRETILYNK